MEKSDPIERLARELDWNLLRTFIVIAKSKSLTEAAEVLRLKQPTLSSALKRLESRVGKRLIDRSPGKFRLTTAGQVLEREAIEIHGAILRLGTLSIDVTASRYAIENLTARHASLAVCLVHDRSPKLRYRRMFQEYFGLFCGPSHPLFGKENLTIADLAGHSSVSFVTDQMDDALRPVTLMRAEAHLSDRVVGTSAHLEEVRRMIIAGLGIGPLPIHVVRRDLEDGQLWQLPPYEDLRKIDVYVVWNPKVQLNRAEQAFLEALIARIDRTDIGERTYR